MSSVRYLAERQMKAMCWPFAGWHDLTSVAVRSQIQDAISSRQPGRLILKLKSEVEV